MNNKGQTLVVFVMLLPFLCILLGYVFDKCYLLYQEKELEDIAGIVCEYALNKDKTEIEIRQLALENDEKIENIEVTRLDQEVQIILEKKQKSMFSSLIGKDSYQMKVKISCVE